MNLNTLAKDVTLKEGQKVNLSIAQVKEVIKIVLKALSELTLDEVTQLLARVKKMK